MRSGYRSYVTLVIGIALLAIMGCAGDGGSGLPDITLSDLSGNRVSLSDFKGKVVILDFWATWCGPCVAEIPHFKELHETYHDRGLEIVGVSVDPNAEEVVPPFVEEHAVPYTILLGDPGLQTKYNLRGLPTTFVIDKKGQVAQKFLGYRDKAIFEKLIKEQLSSS